MSDMMKVFFTGIEEFAKTMKNYESSSASGIAVNEELINKVTALTGRVERLVSILEEKLGTTINISSAKGKRMMDIKKRIVELIEQHPEGIRPPQLARLLGTKVQNLYPHLKQILQQKIIMKDEKGSYFPVSSKVTKSKKNK